MADEQFTLDGDWNVKQKLGARLRAIGYTQQATADQIGVDITTVQRWEENSAFHDYVQQLHSLAWRRIEPAIMANVELAVDVQRQMFIGELKPDDKRYLEARRLIDRILDRLLYVEPADASDRLPAPGASVTTNVLLNTNQPRQA